MKNQILIKIFIYAFALFCLAGFLLYFFQNMVIFQSSQLAADYKYEFKQPFEEHFIPVSQPAGAATLNALWFKAPGDSSKGLILYFHGNRGSLQRWGRYALDLTQYGYDVLMVDYRGYGKSTGKPSEIALYSDAREVLRYAKSKGSYQKLIIYGRSLGSAVASHLAMEVQPDLLILETPFDELRGAIPPTWQFLAPILPLRSVFPNKDHLSKVKCRKVIFHGTDDRIVPLSSALKLLPLLDSPEDFITIPGGGHRNLNGYEQYKVKIRELLERP